MVIPVYGDNSYLEEVKKAGIPTVILEDTYGIRTIDMVQTDCASVSYQIVEELIQNGHMRKQIFYNGKGTSEWVSACYGRL